MTVSSIRALAQVLGISHTALNKHLKAGRFRAEPGGGFDPDKVRAALGQKTGKIPPVSGHEAPAAEAASKASSTLMQIETWPIDRPKPYLKNARKWGAAAVEKIACSIREFGFRQPVVVDGHDVIVIGHLRMAGARLAGLKEVPVHVARDLSPEKIKALRIADNRTHEEAEWNLDLLGPEFLDLKIAGFDMNLTGFDDGEIVESVFGKKSRKTKGGSSGSSAPAFKVVVDCTGEEHQLALLDRFKTEGLNCIAVVS
jgi:hypothetical protein